MPLTDWRGQLSDLAQDLFSIEVNTILASGITGRKMPAWPHALLDIAAIYRRYLLDTVRLDLQDFETVADSGTQAAAAARAAAAGRTDAEGGTAVTLQEAALAELSRNPEASRLDKARGADQYKARTDQATFSQLRYAAAWALHNPTRGPHRLDDDKREILFRIRRNCDQIKGILKALEAEGETYDGVLSKTREELSGRDPKGNGKPIQIPRLPSAFVVQIRKIWDIGTDEVVLQTVIQLDGDVINRAKRDFGDPQSTLWQAHEKMIGLGTKHWRTMFELLSKLVGSAFEALFGRRS